MRTLEEIKSELLAQNPSREYRINDEVFEMTNEEFDEAVNNKAQMVFNQNKELIESEAKRQALLAKLGITEDEARLLLGGN